MRKALIYLVLAFCCVRAIPAERWMTVTAYCACRRCTGHYSGGPTASGLMPVSRRTVAGPAWMPFGSKVYISGVGWRTVEDRMDGNPPGRLDVYFRDHQAALRFGVRKARVYYKHP